MPTSTGCGFAKEQTEVFKVLFSCCCAQWSSPVVLSCCLEVLKQKVLTESIDTRAFQLKLQLPLSLSRFIFVFVDFKEVSIPLTPQWWTPC